MRAAVALVAVLLLAGCADRTRIPLCNAGAPSHLEFVFDELGMGEANGAASEFAEKGWTNITFRWETQWTANEIILLSADCPSGAAGGRP